MTEPVVPAAEPKPTPAEAPKDAPKAAEPAATAAPVEPAKPAEPAKTYTQEEMDRIVKAAKKNERWRTKKEVEAFYQGRESAAPKAPPAPPPAEDKPPTREQYETYEAFLDAKAEYTGRKAAREQRLKDEAETKQRREAEERARRVQDFQGKVNAKYPDLAERAEAIAHIEMPAGMGDAISESELGPDILDHFARNPKDFERIAALSPSAAIREVGKIEARLEAAAPKVAPATAAQAAAPPKAPSAAPAPIAPVGGSTVSGDEEPSHEKPDEWRAWRDRQVAKRRGNQVATARR